MTFNHIIANPPYSLGNQITSTVLDNVDFKEYVNLMPVSKYKKDKIYQYIKPNSLKQVTWDGDAATNPQIAVLTKVRDKNITEAEFNIWCFSKKWKKFYIENQRREHYAVDTCNYVSTIKITPSHDTTVFLTTRTLYDGIHKTENCLDYGWNISKTTRPEDIIDPDNRPRGTFIYFNTKQEKNNFCKWWYASKVWSSVIWGTGKQSGTLKPILPKVDWSREWTDEEILRDYGYTEEEIKELLK